MAVHKVRRSSPSGEVTFEPDGIPQTCNEIRDLNVKISLTKVEDDEDSSNIDIDGVDVNWKVCVETDPTCLNSNEPLQPGEHSHLIKFQVKDKEDDIISQVEFSKCHEECVGESDTNFVAVLFGCMKSYTPEDMLQLLNVL